MRTATRRAGGVDAGAERIDGDGDGHVDDIELVDGLHARSAKARTRRSGWPWR